MTAIKSEDEIELRIRPLLIYAELPHPIHNYNPNTPKVALTEHNHYWFSIADIG